MQNFFVIFVSVLVTLIGIVSEVINIGKFLRALPGTPEWKKRIFYIVGIGIVIFAAIIASFISVLGSKNDGSNISSIPTNSPTITRIAQVQSTLTFSPTVAPSPVPTSPPKPGTVLYQANTPNDWSKWALSSDWKIISYNGLLINNGSAGYGGINGPTAIAPYSVQGLLNFAVEARIEGSVGDYSASPFGIAACSSTYRAGIAYNGGPGAAIWYPNNDNALYPSTRKIFNPGATWHTYRLEVRGNSLKLLIDGASIVSAVDNTYSICGEQVGIWSGRPISVSSFKIITL